MKPAWDQLMEQWKDSKTALIADVDCTKPENEDLCSKQGVEGYPTIKYGKIGALKDYDGERELNDLVTFAKANLGPVCGPKSLDECDETSKKQIKEAMELKDPELQAKIKEKDAEVEKIEKEFEGEMKKLEEKQQELEKSKQAKLDVINKEGLSSLKAVWNDRHPPPPPPPPEEGEDGPDGPDGPEGEEDMGDGDDEEGGKDDGGKEDL